MPRMASTNPIRRARFQGYHNTGKGRITQYIYNTYNSTSWGENLNEFLICNSSYIYNCAQDYREAAAFAFAKKPVLHEECAMLKFRMVFVCLYLLVWQNVHKGHWEDPLPLWLSFDVANLQHRRKTYIDTYRLHRFHLPQSKAAEPHRSYRAFASPWTVYSRP